MRDHGKRDMVTEHSYDNQQEGRRGGRGEEGEGERERSTRTASRGCRDLPSHYSMPSLSCLQYVNGGSLESLLQDHSTSLSWTVRVHLAKDIAVGVAYLHRNGILHRDLNTRVSLASCCVAYEW